MTKRILLSMCLAWVVVLWISLAPVHAATPTGFVSGECIEDIDIPSDRAYECGVVTVPLYADNRAPGVIELPVMIIRSETPNSNLPLYLLQGGPGGDTIETFSYTITKKDSVLPRDRDLIFFEQRGTTLSKPSLNCPEIHDNDIANLDKDMSISEANALYAKAWRACLTRLNGEGIDIAAFNSLANADDVAAIAKMFGHTNIDLYGVSYGSLLAQHVVERHPALIHAVILDGVVPKDREPNLEYQVSKNNAFTNMFADCAADQACNAYYPNLQQTYVKLYNTLEATPLTLELVDNNTDTTHTARIDGESLESILFQLHYDSELVTYLPMLITQIANEKYEVFKMLASVNAFTDTISEGMYNTTMCSEETLPQVTDILMPSNPIIPVAPDMPASDVQWYAETCAAAAVPHLDTNVNTAFATDTPTLLLSGRYDPITPASMGDTVAAGLANATHVVIPNAAHGAFVDNACAAEIGMRFLDNPTATLDTQCVATQKVTFATPDTVKETPFTIQLAMLNESVYLPLAGIGISLIIMLIAAILRPLAWVLRVIQQKPKPTSATRILFGVQWLLIISTLMWLGYVTYICVDILNPDGNYDYHTFFGIPTSYQFATYSYAYLVAVFLGGALSIGAIRTQQSTRWPVIATSILLLTSIVLVVVMWTIGFIGG